MELGQEDIGENTSSGVGFHKRNLSFNSVGSFLVRVKERSWVKDVASFVQSSLPSLQSMYAC